MAESNAIRPLACLLPARFAFHAVFKGNTFGNGEVEQREFQAEGSVDIADAEMMTVGYGGFHHGFAIAASERIGGLSANDEGGQMHIVLLIAGVANVIGLEGSDAVGCAEVNLTVGSLEPGSLHEFALFQTIGTDIRHQCLFLRAILPDALVGAEPDIAFCIFSDVADGFATHGLQGCFVSQSLVVRPALNAMF